MDMLLPTLTLWFWFRDLLENELVDVVLGERHAGDDDALVTLKCAEIHGAIPMITNGTAGVLLPWRKRLYSSPS
jgi:hypothetical protein